jgi:hypothetical protein
VTASGWPQCPTCGYEGPQVPFETDDIGGLEIYFECGNPTCSTQFTADDSADNVVILG